MGAMKTAPHIIRPLNEVADEVLSGKLSDAGWTMFVNWLLTQKGVNVTVTYPDAPLSLVLEIYAQEYLPEAAVAAVADEVQAQTHNARQEAVWLARNVVADRLRSITDARGKHIAEMLMRWAMQITMRSDL